MPTGQHQSFPQVNGHTRHHRSPVDKSRLDPRHLRGTEQIQQLVISGLWIE